jgi:hypothetical protein
MRNHGRTPRPAARLPFDPDGDTGIYVLFGLAVATLVVTVPTLGWHAMLYGRAGVRDVGFAGAAAGYALYLLALAGTVTVYRWGYPPHLVVRCAAAAGLLAVALSVLPHAAAGTDWLTSLLGILLSMLAYAAGAGWALVAARYVPGWLAGWNPETPADQPTKRPRVDLERHR